VLEVSADTERRLGAIEGKLDTLIKFYDEDRQRLAAVEKKVWYTGGVWAVLATIAIALLHKIGLPRA
jgi:hypothetical protein